MKPPNRGIPNLLHAKYAAVVIVILLSFLTIQCSNYKIETIKEFYYGQNGYDTLVPDRFKPYISKKQIKEFEYGLPRWDKNIFKIYHIIYYAWIGDSVFNGRILKDTVIKTGERYCFTDGTFGKDIEYYPDGKIAIERDYAIINDSTKEIISMEDFNKIENKRNRGALGYEAYPSGSWKYYSKEGKLVKEEIYEKGTLLKTINY